MSLQPGQVLTIRFIKPYEGMVGRKALEQTADPFEDAGFKKDQMYCVKVLDMTGEEFPSCTSFLVLDAAWDMQKEDRIFNVPNDVFDIVPEV